MGVRVFFLTLLRVLLFLFSAATLGCHAAQIGLLKGNEWYPKNYSYLLYFIGSGVSMISSIALLFVSISSSKAIRGDRVCGIINSALMVAVVIVCTLKSGPVPWEYNNGDTQYSTGGPTTGFEPSCGTKTDEVKIRCWLSNGTWMGCIVLAVFWIILSFFVFIQQRSDIYEEEYEVYDFKNDIPMAITSNSPIIKQQPSPALSPPPSHAINTNTMNQEVYYDPQPTPNYFDYGYQYHQQQKQYHQQQQQAIMDHPSNNSNNYYYQQQQQQYIDNSSNYSPSPYKNTDETTHILQDTSLPDASANSSHASYTQSPHTPKATVTDSKIKQVPHAY
ncbi:hypothetical protein BJ944DRAFT_266582 [Cunninghamella echinulata]|nr:hypothetical protein BJ944DRAFT_266582 [Cunninghamella echinulata]